MRPHLTHSLSAQDLRDQIPVDLLFEYVHVDDDQCGRHVPRLKSRSELGSARNQNEIVAQFLGQIA